MRLYRAGLASWYIFWEMLPSFILGNLLFIFILLMFQVLRLSDSIISQGIPISMVGQLMFYLSISFLPACLPISLLFSILLTYGKLSSDSEIVAFKSLGLHLGHLLVPALGLSGIVAAFSAYIGFIGAPWGNRSFEVLITKIVTTKAASTIQEGVFSEGFFDLVLYAGKVDSQKGFLEKVFIYDERDNQAPLSVIAKRGRVFATDENFFTKGVSLELQDGHIHRNTEKDYTKVKFDTYRMSLVGKSGYEAKEKSPQSLTYRDIQDELEKPGITVESKRMYTIEFHKRMAISVACLIFGILGVGAGTFTNRRTVKASGFLVTIVTMTSYWMLYLVGESMARQGDIPPSIAMWAANFIFFFVGLWTLKRAW